jgi:orotate phosphoribosyltransferase
MDKRAAVRDKALHDLQQAGVLMVDGHFDYGNGYHGSFYLNPHQLFRYPSTIWRFAQDLIDLLPSDLLQKTELVAGPPIGGALLAHTIAGLLDSRRSLTHAPCLFAPFSDEPGGGLSMRNFYRAEIKGKRVLVADDVRNTGETFAHCVDVVNKAGGIVMATVEICDRMEAIADAGVPNFALAEYKAPENYAADACPLCKSGIPITRF